MDDLVKSSGLLFKYFSPKEHNKNAFEHNQVYFSFVPTFNDPFEMFFVIQQKDKEIMSSINQNLLMTLFYLKSRVCCFTTQFDNFLMWSHYSNSHKGFCVGYNEEDIRGIDGCNLHKVKYQRGLPVIGDISRLSQKDVFFTKGDIWEYEEEYRALIDLAYCFSKGFYTKQELWTQDESSFTFSEKGLLATLKPRVIYIGVKAPDDYKNELISIAKDKRLKIILVELDKNEYKLNFKELLY